MFCAAFFPRICHCEGDEESPLITPCRCTGTLRFVHQSCLHQWIKSSDTRCCELCKYDFIMETKLKPLRKVQCGLWAEQGGEKERAEQLAFKSAFLCQHANVYGGCLSYNGLNGQNAAMSAGKSVYSVLYCLTSRFFLMVYRSINA